AGNRARFASGDRVEVNPLVGAPGDNLLPVRRDGARKTPVPLGGDGPRLAAGKIPKEEARSSSGFAGRQENLPSVRKPVRRLCQESFARKDLRFSRSRRVENDLRLRGDMRDRQSVLPVGGESLRASFSKPDGGRSFGLPDVNRIACPAAFPGLREENRPAV